MWAGVIWSPPRASLCSCGLAQLSLRSLEGQCALWVSMCFFHLCLSPVVKPERSKGWSTALNAQDQRPQLSAFSGIGKESSLLHQLHLWRAETSEKAGIKYPVSFDNGFTGEVKAHTSHWLQLEQHVIGSAEHKATNTDVSSCQKFKRGGKKSSSRTWKGSVSFWKVLSCLIPNCCSKTEGLNTLKTVYIYMFIYLFVIT